MEPCCVDIRFCWLLLLAWSSGWVAEKFLFLSSFSWASCVVILDFWMARHDHTSRTHHQSPSHPSNQSTSLTGLAPMMDKELLPTLMSVAVYNLKCWRRQIIIRFHHFTLLLVRMGHLLIAPKLLDTTQHDGDNVNFISGNWSVSSPFINKYGANQMQLHGIQIDMHQCFSNLSTVMRPASAFITKQSNMQYY